MKKLLFVAMVFLAPRISYAITFYNMPANGGCLANNTVTPWGTTSYEFDSTSCSARVFIPLKTLNEYNAFVNNHPSCIGINPGPVFHC